jgi:uncharacterized protein with GYD domain
MRKEDPAPLDRSKGGTSMATYITLVKLTDQGAKNVKQWGERIQEALQVGAALGVHSRPYMTMGPYDFIGIAEAPDDETMAKVNLSIASRGDVQTQTMRAFGLEEIQQIVEGVR